MNNEITETLKLACSGTTAFLGIGNTDRNDDGAGVALCRLLAAGGVPNVFEGGMQPEKVLGDIRDQRFDSVIFVDAMDLNSEPGAFTILDAQELVSRFPQISTHKLSLGTLAHILAEGTDTKVWLVGIQPKSIDMDSAGLSGARISAEVTSTIFLLVREITNVQEPVCR
ncbi:MAG: hydrogenase maturation protease [Chitinispirillaceae bacterium]|jgi:hydrogenase 3 maturation protease|nr:hydrogenase maturation protease [Chitinispirillaceae bacterium]